MHLLPNQQRLFYRNFVQHACIIIHSSGSIVYLLSPHFQGAQKRAIGVGKSEQRPFFPTHLGLRHAQHSASTKPFTQLLGIHEWQFHHKELSPSTEAGWLHSKNTPISLTRMTDEEIVIDWCTRIHLCLLRQDHDSHASSSVPVSTYRGYFVSDF